MTSEPNCPSNHWYFNLQQFKDHNKLIGPLHQMLAKVIIFTKQLKDKGSAKIIHLASDYDYALERDTQGGCIRMM